MGLHRMFVYGTLKRGEPNYKLITNEDNGSARFVGSATTSDKWPLVIASKFNIPFLLYTEGKGKTIVGEVYEIDDQMLKKMDELEVHPDFYERVQRNVILDNDTGEVLSCWIYFLKKFKPEMLELPYHDNYSSYGSHGLQYSKAENLDNYEDI